MPRGASPKREREYRELESRFKKEGRYKGRQAEVAARIVNKQRAQYGETKGEKAKDRRGQSPDRALPIADYQRLTISEVRSKLRHLSSRDIQQLAKHERSHKNRKTLLEQFDRAKD
jgi:hypothetical protein